MDYNEKSYVLNGIRAGLGEQAPFRVVPKHNYGSEKYLYVSESNGKIMVKDWSLKKQQEYKGSPVSFINEEDKVKITISNIIKHDADDSFYPVFTATISVADI